MRVPHRHVSQALARAAADAIADVLRRHNVTAAEFRSLESWLISVGDNGEWPLLLDMFVERTLVDRAHPDRGASPASTEGPYYLPGQPHLPSPCTLPMRDDEAGTPLILTVRVSETDGSPIAYANLDMWQTDASGHYSGFTPGVPAGNLRGVVVADDHGCFEVETIVPSPYRIPEDGAVGARSLRCRRRPEDRTRARPRHGAGPERHRPCHLQFRPRFGRTLNRTNV